eukprot:TRINITY_DN2103_c0_g1_i1.p1 TRINITY_DN2103_c0_g1~~TRINITY_DN2103_c0_g1_i1.p1  ORF type:complete len:1270 (+),score=197.93 TRINITY_DN2103_c0_g1_i1:111-3920(+)
MLVDESDEDDFDIGTGWGCGWLLLLSAKDTDTIPDLQKKGLLIPVYLLSGLAAGAVAAGQALVSGGVSDLGHWGLCAVSAVLLLIALLPSLACRVSPVRLAEAVSLLLCLACVAVDWRAAAELTQRFWPYTMLVANVCLTVGARSWVNAGIAMITILGITTERVEAAARYGLYEATALGGDFGDPAMCGCVSPPCSEAPTASFLHGLGAIGVWVLGFISIRHVSLALAQEQSAGYHGADAALKVASALVRFDLDAARWALVQMPVEGEYGFRRALESLIDNLTVYKPYLPDSIIQQSSGGMNDSAEFPADDDGGDLSSSDSELGLPQFLSADRELPDNRIGTVAAETGVSPVPETHGVATSMNSNQPVSFAGLGASTSEDPGSPHMRRPELMTSARSEGAASSDRGGMPGAPDGRRLSDPGGELPGARGPKPGTTTGNILLPSSVQRRTWASHNAPVVTTSASPSAFAKLALSNNTPTSKSLDPPATPQLPCPEPQASPMPVASPATGSVGGPSWEGDVLMRLPVRRRSGRARSSTRTGQRMSEASGLRIQRPSVMTTSRRNSATSSCVTPRAGSPLRSAGTRRQLLETGMKCRRSTMACFEAHAKSTRSSEPTQDSFRVCDSFACRVINMVTAEDGSVLHVSGSRITATWNAHRPCPRHAHHGLAAADIVMGPRDGGPRHRGYFAGICSGKLGFGYIGTTQQKHPFAVGQLVEQTRVLVDLGQYLAAPLVIGEPAHDLVSANCVSQVVDCVPRDTRNVDRGDMLVYEVLSCKGVGREHAEGKCLAAAVEALRAGKDYAAATVPLQNLLSITASAGPFSMSSRFQARRLLHLAQNCVQDKPYCRPFVGWAQLEATTRTKQPSIGGQSTQSGPPVDVGASMCSSMGVLAMQPSLVIDPQLGRHISSILTPQMPSPQPGTEFLGRSTSALLREDIKAVQQGDSTARSETTGATFSSEGPGLLPSSWTDRGGVTWRRAETLLGRGAFGEVWLGMTDDGQLCAVKAVRISLEGGGTSGMLPGTVGRGRRAHRGTPSAGARGNQAERELNDLLTEIRILERLRHDNIVCYISSAVVGRFVVLCMEYVPGGSLDSVIKQFRTLAPPSARRYTKEILQGLNFLHENKIVHRDFKPGNVLLQIDGLCKIADFGASAELKKIATDGSGPIGTPLYMAPEACNGQVTNKIDIWGVGITICQMLTGQVPYTFSDDQPFVPQVFVYRLGRDPDAMPVVPDVAALGGSEAVRHFIALCLARDPSDRPSAAAMLKHRFLTTSQ